MAMGPVALTQTDKTGSFTAETSTGQPLALAMQRLWLTGRIMPFGGRLLVHHVFRSDATTPVEAVYAFALPRDATLRRFLLSGEGFRVRSELRPTEDAVHEYERGLERGSLAALARTYRDGVVNLTLGNLRPRETVRVLLEILVGVEAHDDGYRFRFPFTLSPVYHPRARTIEASPGQGEMELPEDEFGDVLLPAYVRDASALHAVGFDLRVEWAGAVLETGSPSHAVRVRQQNGGARVFLAADKSAPDRDLVLDVGGKGVNPAMFAGADAEGKQRFSAFLPSTSFGRGSAAPRQVVIVVDRSGSMEGAPIEQARRSVEACLAVLTESDRFGLVAFDDQVEFFNKHLVEGTRKNRDAAHKFLQKIDARGGTELTQGLRAASKLLASGGDVFLLTDGQVGGTEDIISPAAQTGIRVHCLGIGAASQDRFLAQLARSTGGVSRFLTPRERVDVAAVDLFAATGRPVASEIDVRGATVNPAPPSCVFADTPLMLFGENLAEAGALHVAWKGGALALPRESAIRCSGEMLRLLQGARLIADLESGFAEAPANFLARRRERRVNARLRALSETYGLQSREMSLVAVVEREGDRPGELPETVVVPVGMPQDVRFEAYFPGRQFQLMGAAGAVAKAREAWLLKGVACAESARLSEGVPGVSLEQTGQFLAMESTDSESRLLQLCLDIEPDGGMPGRSVADRALRTLVVLLAFLSDGHTPTRGAFRAHVTRLLEFLAALDPGTLTAEQAGIVERAVNFARAGKHPEGEWLSLAASRSGSWREVDSVLPAA